MGWADLRQVLEDHRPQVDLDSRLRGCQAGRQDLEGEEDRRVVDRRQDSSRRKDLVVVREGAFRRRRALVEDERDDTLDWTDAELSSVEVLMREYGAIPCHLGRSCGELRAHDDIYDLPRTGLGMRLLSGVPSRVTKRRTLPRPLRTKYRPAHRNWYSRDLVGSENRKQAGKMAPKAAGVWAATVQNRQRPIIAFDAERIRIGMYVAVPSHRKDLRAAAVPYREDEQKIATITRDTKIFTKSKESISTQLYSSSHFTIVVFASPPS